MLVMGLPGRNRETGPWLERLLKTLQPDESRYSVVRYRHWDSGMEADVTYEASRVTLSADVCVVAKSLGTMIALEACAGSRTLPSRIVFIGTPVGHYSDRLKLLLRERLQSTPVLFVQQVGDFTGAFRDLQDLVGDCHLATLEEIDGSDHVYEDTDQLASIISGWMGN